MTQLNPYKAPETDAYYQKIASRTGAVIAFLVIIIVSTELVSWNLLPLGNGLVAELFYPVDSAQYWTVRYASDVLLTFLLFCVASLVSIKLTKINAHHAALPIGIVGFVIFFIELGGLECLGSCGPPLWYDLLSIFKHLSASLLVASVVSWRSSRGGT